MCFCYTEGMADLTYNDIQRAAQDAVRNVHQDVQRLSALVGSVQDQTQYIDDIQRDLQNLQRVQSDIVELKQRIVNIEKFCSDMGNYFREKQDLEKEDQEYRSISPR